MKQKYDSSEVFLYATGSEELLPKEFPPYVLSDIHINWQQMKLEK